MCLLKVELSCFKKVGFICFNKSPFKNDEKCFLFQFIHCFRPSDLKFCADIFGLVGKPLDKKTKINFKIYDDRN